MAKVNLRDAAELLELSQSSLRRRIALLGHTPEVDDKGRILVDVVEHAAQWEARRKARPAPRRKNSTLTLVIDDSEREEIDGIAEKHELSVGETSRRLLRRGLVGYYGDGRTL